MVSKSKILGKSSLIFVTVGTTNFPFDRLFIAIDNVLEELKSEAKLVVQAGNSTYKWKYKNIELYSSLKPKTMEGYFIKADRIITHGGYGTIFQIMMYSKCTPLIVPRLEEYSEHVNDHQKIFCRYLSKADLNIKVSRYKDKLSDSIASYLKKNCDSELINKKLFQSNPRTLCDRLKKYMQI